MHEEGKGLLWPREQEVAGFGGGGLCLRLGNVDWGQAREEYVL